MKITSFQVVDHGIEHAQYFQGCGVAFTEYDECVTGCGNDAAEALEDAIESLCQTEDVTTAQAEAMHLEIDSADSDTVPEDSEELCYYVSIRYSIEPSEVAK